MIESTINIYFSDDSEALEIEAVDRGWRNDVYVLIDNLLFHLNVYTIERLDKDFKIELEYYGYYTVDSNMILVISSDKNTIISTILHLYKQAYFKEIKPEANNNVDKLIKVY